MNNKKIAEAFGGIDDSYLNEALEYKRGSQRGGITMSKKKIAVLVAVIAAIIMTIPVGAAIDRKRWISYYASLESGSSVNAPKGSVELKATKTKDGIDFTVEVDKSKALFTECSEVKISSWMVWDGAEALLGTSKNYWDERFDNSSWFDDPPKSTVNWGSDDFNAVIESFASRNNKLRLTYTKRTTVQHTYTMQVYSLTGRNSNGELIEIRGEWEIDFTI